VKVPVFGNHALPIVKTKQEMLSGYQPRGRCDRANRSPVLLRPQPARQAIGHRFSEFANLYIGDEHRDIGGINRMHLRERRQDRPQFGFLYFGDRHAQIVQPQPPEAPTEVRPLVSL
jgi:hypothetical protein